MNPSTLLRSLSWILSLSAVAVGQCVTTLRSGGPIGSVRGTVLTSMLWDPDGAGPLPVGLLVGGLGLVGGDEASGQPLLFHDGTQWRGLGLTGGLVRALTTFNGELVVGGFGTYSTSTGTGMGVMRWSGSAWLPLASGIPGVVNALTVFNGELIAGGNLLSAGGVATSAIAKWNGVSWSTLGSGLVLVGGEGVRALAVFSGGLYAGGRFSGAGSVSALNLARWNGTSWFAVGNPDAAVRALAVRNGTSLANSFLFASGDFVTIGNVAASRVAQLNGATSVWSPMGTGLPGDGQALLVRATGINRFEVLAGVSRTGDGRRVWRWSGTAWNSLGSFGPLSTSLSAWGVGLQFYGGTYVAGLELDGWPNEKDTPSVLRFEADWTPLLGPGLGSPVECLVHDGPDAIVGGAFASIDGVTVNGIARRSGSSITALGSGVQGGSAAVHALARAGNGDLFAAGSFTTAGGNPASNVARWNGSGWSPLGTGTDAPVYALMIARNGDLIVGGDFSVAGGIACNRVARWNGSLWGQLSSGMDDTVLALAELANGALVAGGAFRLAGGNVCERAARWNGTTWVAMSSGMDAEVRAFARLPNGDLVAGGSFTRAGSNPSSHPAVWNGSVWSPMGSGLSGVVDSLLTLADGDVLAGGNFVGSPFDHLARWSGTNWSAGFGVVGATVRALAAAPNGEILVGGDFYSLTGSPPAAAGCLAVFTTNCPALATPVPTGCIGPAGPVVLVADALPWIGSAFRSTARGFAAPALVVALLGFNSPNLPLSLIDPSALPNCSLLASTEVASPLVPIAGVASYQFTIPNLPALAGFPLWHQFIQIEAGTAGRLLSLSSSNALALVLGSL